MEREEEEFQQRKRDRERRIIRIEKQELNSRLLEVIKIYISKYVYSIMPKCLQLCKFFTQRKTRKKIKIRKCLLKKT